MLRVHWVSVYRLLVPWTSADGVGAAGSPTQDLRRLVQLESLFESIRSAPLDVVDQLVREIRKAHGRLKKDLITGPWEEGKLPSWNGPCWHS